MRDEPIYKNDKNIENLPAAMRHSSASCSGEKRDMYVLPVDPAYADLEVFKTWLSGALASYPDHDVARNTKLEVDGYDVVDKMEYPSDEQLEKYDVVMMTGSKHTAQDTENPFIPKLIQFIKKVASIPRIQIVGVCFGHQIVSLALGGECVRGENGWEVGVYANELTDEGRYWWTGDVSGQGGSEKIFVQQMHRDHVPSLTPGFKLLASTPRYPVHSMVKLHPDSTPQSPKAQILTIQGHPEFTPDIVDDVINLRTEMGIFDEVTSKEARRRAGGKDGSGGEGLGRVGWAILRMMLQ